MVIVFSLIVGILLGLFGGGAGILTVPVLHYALAMPMEQAITTSLFILFITSTVSTLHYASKNSVNWHHGITLVLSGAAGAVTGGQLAHHLAEHALMLMLVAIMIASAGAILCRRTQLNKCEHSTFSPHPFLIILIGFFIGLITGMLGAGGGFLVVPALILLFHQDMRSAVGTSVFIIMSNTAFGLFSHFSYHQMNWSLITLICGFAIVGTFIGHRLAFKLDTRTLHTSFAVFIIVLAFILAAKELPLIPQQSWYQAHPLLWLAVFILMLAGLFYFLTRICMRDKWHMPFISR